MAAKRIKRRKSKRKRRRDLPRRRKNERRQKLPLTMISAGLREMVVVAMTRGLALRV